ncbi:MAG TPA: M66 family metalloprotease [Luteolibacter sp.]|nr:M66 family metalloprotease [Luteolibacter sp.]
MRSTLVFSLALAASIGAADAVSIDAVYFGQTHMHQPDHPYFGLVGEREALIKAHVTDPATPAAPAVTAVLTLNGDTLNLPLSGPATLPASIPDGLGVVQHSFTDTFTATIPAAWVKTGLQVTVNAGPASVDFTDMKVGAPTKVVMTMFDVNYFADVTGDYPAGTFAELEAKWPVADLEIRRVPDVIFRELVIPPRPDVGTTAVRVSSPADYLAQTGLNFDGEQAAALAWNGALKRAAGRSGRISLYYTNIYGVNAGGQAGGFAGVGNGTAHGIFHHELGHALSLPHWGGVARYPYRGDMYGISAPEVFDDVHVGPVWGYDMRTHTFIPPTVQPGNVGGRPVGTYKVDPMQGGGTGSQEPGFLLNHFSDYSVFEMRNYLHSHVLIWNPSLNSYASWNQTAAAYTSTVSNNGVQFPIERDAQVISVMASISGAKPDVNMVYPPIGPYTAGLIKLFDPRDASDRAEAAAIFAPAGGCDLSLRVIQGGVEKIYMLAAPWEPGASPLAGSSLKTEAINLPAADGPVTLAELLLTPDAQINGLPADPEVLYTWAPIIPDPAGFAVPPAAGNSSSISMTANTGFSNEGPVEYLFTETTGNPGGSSSGWQSSPIYTDIGLQASTTYTYTVTQRAGGFTGRSSDPASAKTPAAGIPGEITFDGYVSGYIAGTPKTFTFDASASDKLVVIVSGEHSNPGSTAGNVKTVTYDGVSLIKAVEQNPFSPTLQTTSDLWYLDNPGSVHTAGQVVISVEGNGNNYVHATMGLSGTAPGFFGASAIAIGTPAVNMNVSWQNSMVISWMTLGGSGNTAATATSIQSNSPADAVTFGGATSTGNYAGHVLSRSGGLTPGMHTFSFNTSLTDVLCLAAEFLAAEVPATDYQVWSLQYPDDDLTDPNADFDGDGMRNDEERIWGLDPTSGASASAIQSAPSPATGTFTYTRRRPALTGCDFHCEWSTSLKPDEWFSFAPANEWTQTAGDIETVEITLPGELLTESRIFIRVVAKP